MKGKDDFFLFAIDFYDLVSLSFPELLPNQLERVASTELRDKLPFAWQCKLDELHVKDGRTQTFSHDKEWCLTQQ
ncbi:MAG: hypothetical protein GY845_07170, partial [Planctomycetes bacterium]|nr:hypothetical protein [Planctomycetota bacterium]